MGISSSAFEFLRHLILEHSAIVLEDGKEYLVEMRLGPLARREGHASVEALTWALRQKPAPALVSQVVDAMTTNETSFFRDFHPFEALRREVFPALIRARAASSALTIWSAASSTGQEAYTLAMLVCEHFPELAGWRVQIVGSDLSEEVLARARAGRYSQFEVGRGLPPALLAKYFDKQGPDWVAREKLRSMVQFRRINLIREWHFVVPFDLILMRNVLIYFDVATKRAILARARRVLKPDGFLFLGTAETTISLDAPFVAVSSPSCCYYKPAA